jgi:hypothetical protein
MDKLILMKFDIAKFCKNLSVSFNLHAHVAALTTTT